MNTGDFMAMRSPADALIGSRFIRAIGAIQINQIQNNLIWLQVLREQFLFNRFVANDYHFSASHHLLKIGGKQRSDVRNYFLDVLTIGTREMSNRNILIPDSHLTALSEQPLYQLHLRALPQIVRSGFEAQPKQR